MHPGRLKFIPGRHRLAPQRFPFLFTLDILRDRFPHDPVGRSAADFGQMLDSAFQLVIEL
ncbi:MAG: hypothetical protein BGO05_30485 [Rhizobiales bacterium 63-7]|nr:MAG: hypothetical protein BGO05_30485 [Rhizobiales bacterium 63-7]